MRIISGVKRGKKLFTPQDERVRPTSDKAREALFSILKAKYFESLENVKIADVFSGTGAVGLEAISRGAEFALFIDIDLKLTKKNVQQCGFSNVAFLERDVKRLPRATHTFDLVFMDAPYNKGLSEVAITSLIDGGYVGKDTLLVVEAAVDEPLMAPETLMLIEERAYGAARFVFFRYKS